MSAWRSSAASTGRPANASRTAAGRPCSSTLSSCGRSSVASSPLATRMKIGAPNGAAASSRADDGGARPAVSRARKRWPPIDPLPPISAVMVVTARHAFVASARAEAASDAGAPGPPGSFISGVPHPPHVNATTHAARRTRGTRRNRVCLSAFVAGLLLVGFLFRRPDLLVDFPAIDRIVVARQRARPGGDRVVVLSELEEHVAVVILDHRVALQLIRGPAQAVFGQIELRDRKSVV